MTGKKSKSHKLSVYSNLLHSKKSKKDSEVRKHAQYLASLPKNPIKRFFYRLSPKHVFKFWFSKRGLIMALKIVGVMALLGLLFVGGLFAYYRKDLDSIRPGELAKRVQTTVTTYLDRNGEVLWLDKGESNYKLVVESSEISDYLKQATIAIEDKNFYIEGGISISGLIRAAINNFSGGSTQGGSTLTQQLVKQVFFADEAQLRGISGIPRKIKEMILSIEVERMYNKDQILTLYLNESPYGGRRNGAESAAQTYFDKSAKDLTIAEAALLAAIPQNPSVYNPYNIDGHADLIDRQHTVISYMADQGYITKEQADEAILYPIIDHISPEASQYTDIRAPHFVQMARAEIQETLGTSTVGNGGLTVTTTLDLRIQTKLEEAMNTMFSSSLPTTAGFSNGAATVADVKTSQIIALMGSRDFNYAGYGQDNAATAYIQPGSTVKPMVYAELFEKKATGQANYGSGSIFNDVNIDSIYGAPVFNADRKFLGPITIRYALANSRNIPAIEAMYISGVKTDLDTMHALGATSYCTQGTETQVGLAAAIGGCGVKQVDLVNSYVSLARQGAYKPQSTVLEVKDNQQNTLYRWSDTASVQVLDPQSVYVVTDILTDDVARAPLNGRHAIGMEIPGIKTATKTGTSDKGGYAKDVWMMSYSPVLVMGVWLGNSDASLLRNGRSSMPGPIVATVMSYAHNEIYAPSGLWTSGDWFKMPSGVQNVNGELYPSWWNATQGKTDAKLFFDTVSKKKATACTPDSAKIELDVQKMVDPITKKDVYIVPDGYDGLLDDDVHSCSDAPAGVSVEWSDLATPNTYQIEVSVSQGTFPITSVDILANGSIVSSTSAPGPYTFVYTVDSDVTSDQTVTAVAHDTGLYASASSPASTKIPAYITPSP